MLLCCLLCFQDIPHPGHCAAEHNWCIVKSSYLALCLHPLTRKPGIYLLEFRSRRIQCIYPQCEALNATSLTAAQPDVDRRAVTYWGILVPWRSVISRPKPPYFSCLRKQTACSWYTLPQSSRSFSLRWVLPRAAKQRGEIWIRWMSEGLAWQLLILLLQEWSRTHLEQQCVCVRAWVCTYGRRVFLPSFLLFDTSIKAFKRVSRTVWHTWRGADAMRCYHFE